MPENTIMYTTMSGVTVREIPQICFQYITIIWMDSYLLSFFVSHISRVEGKIDFCSITNIFNQSAAYTAKHFKVRQPNIK